jgi:hypothetical protein
MSFFRIGLLLIIAKSDPVINILELGVALPPDAVPPYGGLESEVGG